MASQNDIANWALDLVGEPSITDISDTTERATRLRNAWDNVRDAALRARLWRFSIARDSLAAMATAPAWGFDYQYQVEADVVRLIQVDQYYHATVLSDYIASDTAPYRYEQDRILTDIAAPLKVKWALNSVAVGLWDPCFARVMACDLADRISTRLTESETMKSRIKAERVDALREAARANAIEQPPQMIADGSWVASRYDV